MAAHSPDRYPVAIRASGLTIYDPVEAGHPELWIPGSDLETILATSLCGVHLGDLPLRTRSKVAKQLVCSALGYPVPERFKRTRPRFPGQRFDIFVQKANNLQIWNDDMVATRRYVIIRLNRQDTVTCVRAVTGDVIAELDNTGTLTGKYQAKLALGDEKAELVARVDTKRLQPFLGHFHKAELATSPVSEPEEGRVLPISTLFATLRELLGTVLPDVAADQERARGALLHGLVCRHLGYEEADDGRFPDIRHQLLEIKLQLSRTVDLGLIRPDDDQGIDMLAIEGNSLRPCDIRYAIFHASQYGPHILLTHLFVTTGRDFFARFPRMEGRVINRKLQISLPPDFFRG